MLFSKKKLAYPLVYNLKILEFLGTAHLVGHSFSLLISKVIISRPFYFLPPLGPLTDKILQVLYTNNTINGYSVQKHFRNDLESSYSAGIQYKWKIWKIYQISI